MMVTDLQGFGSILTDPQIHCIDKGSFGKGNLGAEGMDQFFMRHSCSNICTNLKLERHPMQLLLDETSTVGSESSASSSQSSNGSHICELCGILFKLTKQEYQDAINKYQAGRGAVA